MFHSSHYLEIARKETSQTLQMQWTYENAEKNYNKLVNTLKENTNLNVQSGEFGFMMEIELINNGPVTIILEK